MDFFMNEVAISSSRRQRSAWLRPRVARSIRHNGRPEHGAAQSRSDRAVTEEGPPDPDHGRPFGQGDLEIIGHAHRPDGQAQPVGQPGDLAEARPGLLGGSGRPHGHQPGHVQVLVPQGGHQIGHVRPGGTPPRPGSPATSTWTSTRAPGWRGRWPGPRRSCSRPASRRPAGPAGAPCCAGWPRGSATAGPAPGRRPRPPPWPPARRRSSPPPRSDPAPGPCAPHRGRTPW